MTTLEELAARRPPNWDEVERHKARMIAEIRSYKLKELREQLSLTQVEVAESLEVSQNRVSAIESGEINRSQVDTIRRYVEALGGTLKLEVEIGEESFQIA